MDFKSIKIKKDIHKKLKIYCSENDLQIGNLIENLILEKILKENDINRKGKI